MTTDQLAARANYTATQAHDAWKLGVLTASLFAEVTEGCLNATKALRSGDEDEALRLLDEAADLLEFAC